MRHGRPGADSRATSSEACGTLPAGRRNPGSRSTITTSWRIATLGPNSHFFRHARKQVLTPAYQRSPMPGESYLATVPLPICRAADEARRRVAQALHDPAILSEFRIPHSPFPISHSPSFPPSPLSKAICDNLHIERARQLFSTRRPAAARTPNRTAASSPANPRASGLGNG